MDDQFVIFRPAKIEDVANIQELLHSDYRETSIGEISTNIKHYFLLYYGRKLLGITYQEVADNSRGNMWTSVHSMFSQSAIETVSHYILKGIWRLDCPNELPVVHL